MLSAITLRPGRTPTHHHVPSLLHPPFPPQIACAEHLVSSGLTSPSTLCISGRSAGGLTMGATVNMRPDLFRAVIMGVPFVDVLTTMMDPSIPLTEIEWDEWGNPLKDEEYYQLMKSYSPVDNGELGDGT